jgi:branched-chain amino acid transport system permease protein
MFATWTKRLNTGLAAYGVIAVWLVLTVGILFYIARTMLLWPLWSSIVFPLFAALPLVVIGANINPRARFTIGILIVALIVPLVGMKDGFYLELATQIGIFAALALGLNVVIGFAGLLDLGYVAFFAIGAYLWAVFTSNADTFLRVNGWIVPSWTFYIFILLGVIFAALGGLLLGLPVLRLRGDYLAIVTLGFGEIIRILVTQLDKPINITNGPQGLERVAQPPLPEFIFEFSRSIQPWMESTFGRVFDPVQLVYQLFFYFLVLIMIGICVVVAGRLDNSPIGRAWNAIREDEIAAIAMGVPLVRMKLLAFATGAAFAGAMGAIFAARQRFVSPESFNFNQSIAILAMVIVGGMGSIRGVIIGAATVVLLDKLILTNLAALLTNLRNANFIVPIINWPIREWPNQLAPTNFQRFVFGLLLIIMMIFRPAGLLPARRRMIELPAKEELETSPSSLAIRPARAAGD